MSKPTFEAARCPACGTLLPTNRLKGLCPACTWNGLFDSDEDLPSSDFRLRPTPARQAGAARAEAEKDADRVLMRLPGHEVCEEIARGGIGVVYRARQLDPPRWVALKMLLPHQLGSGEMAERFRLEARTLADLEHSAILPVYQFGEHEGMPYFTMKLAGGGTLAQRRNEYAGRWRAIAELMVSLAEGVQFAHERGVLHRDLKPGNVLFDEQGRAYVSDFGLAKLVSGDSELTRSVDVLGTPSYVAPEVAAGSAKNATIASDVYSLGAILYELLAGRVPFEAEGLPALMRKIAEEEAVAPSRKVQNAEFRGQSAENRGRGGGRDWGGMPRDLEVICLKCLAKAPAARYGSAHELVEDLRRWLEGRPIAARPATGVERLMAWRRRNPVVATLTVALAVVLVVAAVLQTRALRQSRRAESEAVASLHSSLLTEARARRRSGQMGQRYDTLETIRRAAQIRPTLELRNELAATLATPDLRLERKWPIWFKRSNSMISFSADLSRYIEGNTNGGFAIRSAEDRSVITQFRSTNSSSLARAKFSSDERGIAAEYYDGSLEAWNVGDGQPWLSLPGAVINPALAAFGPRGGGLAVNAPGEGIFRYSITNGTRQLLYPTAEPAFALRFNQHGDRLAVVRAQAVELWSGASQRPLWSTPVSNAIPWVALSPEGRWVLVSSEWAQDMLVLESTTGRVVTRFALQGYKADLFEFSPDGLSFASESWDRSLRLWDVMTGEELLRGPASVRALRFSVDGRRLAASPGNFDVGHYEVAPREVFRELRPHTATKAVPSGFARSTTGRFLISSAEDRLVFWDTLAGEEIHSVTAAGGPRTTLFFDAKDEEIICSRWHAGITRRTFTANENRASGHAEITLGPERPTIEFTNSFLWDVAQINGSWLVKSSTGKAYVWPNGDRARAPHPVAPSGGWLQMRISPDARWMVTMVYPGADLYVWDVKGRKNVQTFHGHSVGDAWFSPDNEWLIAGTPRDYRLWKVGTWEPGPVWPVELEGVVAGMVAFAGGGKLAALLDRQDTFRLITFPEGRELARLEPPTYLGVAGALMNEEGTKFWILGFGNRVYQWDLAALRREFAGYGLDWKD